MGKKAKKEAAGLAAHKPAAAEPIIVPDELTCFKAMLATVMLALLALMFIISKKDRKNLYLRFYSVQSLGFLAAQLVQMLLFSALSPLLSRLGTPFAPAFLSALCTLLILVYLVIAAWKAYNGIIYKAPLIGGLCYRLASKPVV